MQNAPFKFAPDNWFVFFSECHWKARETRYLGEESEKLGRAIPMPWWASFLCFFFRSKNIRVGRTFSAYVLLEPSNDWISPESLGIYDEAYFAFSAKSHAEGHAP